MLALKDAAKQSTLQSKMDRFLKPLAEKQPTDLTVALQGVSKKGIVAQQDSADKLLPDSMMKTAVRWKRLNSATLKHKAGCKRLKRLDPATKKQEAQKRSLTHNKLKDAERQKKARKAAPRKNKAGVMPQMCRASRTEATVSRQGTWRLAAEKIAMAEGNGAGTRLLAVAPPSFAALNDPLCLKPIKEMYELLGQHTQWLTCVICWQAWYTVDSQKPMSHCPAPGRYGISKPWFNCQGSEVLSRWRFGAVYGPGAKKKGVDWFVGDELARAKGEARLFLHKHYSADIIRQIMDFSVDVRRQRDIVICKICEESMDSMGVLRRCDLAVDPWSWVVEKGEFRGQERWHQHFQEAAYPVNPGPDPVSPGPDAVSFVKLGLPLHQIAPPLAALTDFEEMVLALVHPLVQVYTIPTTGELAYVGHVCNFRQKVSKFLSSIPALKQGFPAMVVVRPRQAHGQGSNRLPFPVNVKRLREAYMWLKVHNPYYKNVLWDEVAADSWEDASVELPTKEYDTSESVTLFRAEFCLWMEAVTRQEAAGVAGFQIGRRLQVYLSDPDSGRSDALQEAASGCSDAAQELWNRLLGIMADDRQKASWRYADGIKLEELAFFMRDYIALDLGSSITADCSVMELLALPFDERSDDYRTLTSELQAIKTVMQADECPEEIGVIPDKSPAEDLGLREETLEDLANVVKSNLATLAADTESSTQQAAQPLAASEVIPVFDTAASTTTASARGAPRVDAPEIEDKIGQVIPENEPGYIPCAFPKLFPFGIGDYHDAKRGLKGRDSFADWGRFIMLWHDGRFMRHTRFRYWFLDTWLRALSPSQRNVFMKIYPNAAEATLSDLQDPVNRRTMVKQMSTTSANIPGSISERGQMRQHLEAMVDQIEHETADLGENHGAGRLPAGFCTLTCQIFKWEQLYKTILKSYETSSEEYRAWLNIRGQSPSCAREAAMKQLFYRLAHANPGVVAWYCALKLEMGVALTRNLLTRQLQGSEVPGKAAALDLNRKVRAESAVRTGLAEEDFLLDDFQLEADYGRVDESYATFEWSAGGMVHVHIALWISGSPRIDKVSIPSSKTDAAKEVHLDTEDRVELEHGEAANRLATFYDRAYTEYSMAKATTEELASKPGRRQRMSKKDQRAIPSPECISESALLEMLDGCQEAASSTDGWDESPWDELDRILYGHYPDEQNPEFRGPMSDVWSQPLAASAASPWQPGRRHLDEAGELNKAARRARARRAFVATLSEWMQMHDYHSPFPNGSPAKGQSCAKVENEHSSQEKVFCGKLFPRKPVLVGEEEVVEDPRRRELYRLWLARNCAFFNNFVPLISLAMLANMDFQATTTKFAVIEYMTKYITKAGHGNMMHVMEHSFSLCLEKAREMEKGVGAAIQKWFNLQSIAEAKSQLETMHLNYDLPRYLSTREFRRLSTRAARTRMKDGGEVNQALASERPLQESLAEPLAAQSAAQIYLARDHWQVPNEEKLKECHPLTGHEFWYVILVATSSGIAHSESRLEDHQLQVEKAWPSFVQRLSWWEYVRCFKKVGLTLRFKPVADVVFVTPYPRLKYAIDDAQWCRALRDALLAFCNHGPRSSTFASAAALDDIPDDEVQALMHRFVSASKEQRARDGLCTCPPFLKRGYQLAKLRMQKLNERKRSKDVVQAALHVTFVFDEEERADACEWRCKLFADMTEEEQMDALQAWRAAQASEDEDAPAPGSAADVVPAPGSAAVDAPAAGSITANQAARELEDAVESRAAMSCFMMRELKWTQKELHDAVVCSGMTVPYRVTLLNYFHLLYRQFENKQYACLPQNTKSHTKRILQGVLKVLSRTGARLGGWTASKNVLIERLATWMNIVVEKGRASQTRDLVSGELDDESDAEHCAAPLRKQLLNPMLRGHAEVPADAIVDPVQAESALGRVQATELDDEDLETQDAALRAEEEALLGCHVNPQSPEYPCLAIDCSAGLRHGIGWHPPLIPRKLARDDFGCSSERIRAQLAAGIQKIQSDFNVCAMGSAGEKNLAQQVESMDPTQHEAFAHIQEWARDRLQWRQQPQRKLAEAPKLRMLLLGTAGTGKTHTAKAAVMGARRILGSFDAVKMIAHTGVAAANLGGGACTIDSLFQTQQVDDLSSDALDRLVGQLRHVELLVIDEISMVGAGQFEMISRRLEQVAKALWQERRMNCQPLAALPEDFGGFGGIGVVCMGDFAQLSPIRATSLLRGSRIEEGVRSGLRHRAMQGRLQFEQFMKQVIRLRRIHRQKGADAYKESTMRLRDAAITPEDHLLWQQHVLVSPETEPTWEGGEGLQKTALVLVAQNAIAGRVNGQRLKERTRRLEESVPASATGIVVRCDAMHNDVRAERRPADQYRSIRKAVHLCAGAPVMLLQNMIWDTPVVQLGLMNGARGVVVAILYVEKGEKRTDRNQLAGVGIPAPGRTSSTRPLPDFVVVNFPEYTGPPLFPGLPRTWVPISPAQVANKDNKKYLRVGLPLVCAWSMTIHKSQGISAAEGCIVSMETIYANSNPVSSTPGLAFVGWTRVTKWSRMAFCELPALVDFLAVRLHAGFKVREDFEARADVAHDAFLQQRNLGGEAEVLAHLKHFTKILRIEEKREPSAEEIADVRHMLSQRGVRPISDSAMQEAKRRYGSAVQMPLTQVVQALRGQRGSVLRRHATGKPQAAASGSAAASSSPWQCTDDSAALVVVCQTILQEHGYPEDHILEAINCCGANVKRAIDFCLRKQEGAVGEESALIPDQQGISREYIVDLGFPEDDIIAALEQVEFDFTEALRFLLTGIEGDVVEEHWKSNMRAQQLTARLKRRSVKQVKNLPLAVLLLSKGVAEQQYAARAAADLGRPDLLAYDLGWQGQQGTTNACFWLCLAAGWSQVDSTLSVSWREPTLLEVLTYNDRQAVAELLRQKVHHAKPPRIDNALGVLALKLRQHFCGFDEKINVLASRPQSLTRETCVMRRPDVVQRFCPAFAALSGSATAQALQMYMYKAWIQRVRVNEYADELIVAAAASELAVRIVCVPYTPADAQGRWKISSYCAPTASAAEHARAIYLGNNDVHYMLLSSN